VLLLLLSVSLSPGLPQKPASISGTVTDQTGAVVTGATITITNSAGLKLTATSDGQGN
jgi:hypothetical protein